MYRKPITYSLLMLLIVSLAACGGSESGDADAPSQPEGLTAAQLENGIGPIENLTLAALDTELAAQGEELYTIKCSACHKMAERYVGPPLGTILANRTPAFVMNMILNPEEMVQKHPEARALLAQYMTPMANQNLTQEEARAVLEYLRTVQEE